MADKSSCSQITNDRWAAPPCYLSLRLDVKIDDSVIEQVSSHKILGVVIDSQMNYESHIDELCKNAIYPYA